MPKEWWEQSPEEFANGFTEEAQVHHGPESEQEPMAINQNSNEAMAALYGPAATHSEYSRFTRVRYRADGTVKQGMIIWITAPTADAPMLYVVEPASGGFPEWIAGGDITGTVEE